MVIRPSRLPDFISKGLAVFFFILNCVQSTSAQILPEYNMADTTISLCMGILYDSGGEDGLYDNNENLTTVINPGGTITLTFFGTFAVENNLDHLTIYDGPDTSSPVLAVFSGTSLPPVITANSGSVTLVFSSDNSAIYAGFSMQWQTDIPPPVPPVINVLSQPVCQQNTLSINFSTPVQCTWLANAEWTVTRGNQEIQVTSVIPNCSNGSTLNATLVLAEPFTANCTYSVELIIEIPDDCDLLYTFTITTEFVFDNCGVSGAITSTDNSVCPGECAQLMADVDGCFTYTYTWNNGLPPTPGPHNVCPSEPTMYTVTVTETETGNMATFSYSLQILSSQILQADTTLCQSADAIVLNTGITGIWAGPGIIDEVSGIFEPDSAMAGENVIHFEALGCMDSVIFIVLPISTDNITAACPGSPPFQLNAEPAGGFWNGPFTTSGGTFHPSVEGAYTVNYTLGSCVDVLLVNVDSITGIFELDSICQSIHTDTLMFEPLGGYWSGPGIADSLLGIFVPEDAPPGDVQLLYTINGCDQTAHVFVKQIQIGGSYHTTCPEEDPLVWYNGTPLPSGGYWTGAGLLSSQTGLFDPSLIPNDAHTSIIYYAPNGCSDTTYIYNRKTEIELSNASFCLADDAVELNEENVGNVPSEGGLWTGSGVIHPGDDYWLFSPQASGTGQFVLVYEKNTCVDSMHVTVYPDGLNGAAYVFCSNEEGTVFGADIQSGGAWTGSGITNSATGAFDPAVADSGNYYVVWSTDVGCRDSISVTVEEFFQAAITGLGDLFCNEDSLYAFTVYPDVGTITGANPDFTFNPAIAGEGDHEVIYTYDGVYCSSSDTVNVYVYPPIYAELDGTDEQICNGDAVVLNVVAGGGNPDILLQYEWSDDAFPINTNTVQPSENTTIYVYVTDGCSDAAIDSFYIEVLAPIEVDVTTSDTLCFGDEGFALASAVSEGTFSYIWDDDPGENIEASAGSQHVLTVVDLINGCVFDSLVLIPNYPPVSAAFSINPDLQCIPFEAAASVQIIDLSLNAVSGIWDLGDGITQAYVFGETPVLSFSSGGDYPVSLRVVNEGNCPDSATIVICVLPATPVFIPELFSPNNDGNNDFLFVRSHGIVSMEFVIYNRWGEVVFKSGNVEHGWDGMQRGQPAPSGVYFYYLKAKLNDESQIELKGEIDLIR